MQGTIITEAPLACQIPFSAVCVQTFYQGLQFTKSTRVQPPGFTYYLNPFLGEDEVIIAKQNRYFQEKEYYFYKWHAHANLNTLTSTTLKVLKQDKAAHSDSEIHSFFPTNFWDIFSYFRTFSSKL